jgi:GNAT superfamily N-acetyltransferase
MESTEHGLDDRHLAGCLTLSRSANWNQNEADWRVMLAIGRGWGITLSNGTLAASTIVLPYGGKFAWVSMVLVLPEQRRKGYATQLLKRALRENTAARLTSILDATPAGHEVYCQEGFHDRWGFKRYALAAPMTGFMPVADVRPLLAKDWAPLLALDLRAFGASRERLLRNLAGRLPSAALVAERDGTLAGFVLGREGREANQIGPLVARDEEAALVLLNAALSGVRAPVYVDIADHAPALQAWAQARGFSFQRPFTRMVHGTEAGSDPGPAPGEEALVFCPAGPELG